MKRAIIAITLWAAAAVSSYSQTNAFYAAEISIAKGKEASHAVVRCRLSQNFTGEGQTRETLIGSPTVTAVVGKDAQVAQENKDGRTVSLEITWPRPQDQQTMLVIINLLAQKKVLFSSKCSLSVPLLISGSQSP